MPSCYPHFPQGSHISAYLRDYANRFDLKSNIHLEAEVTKATQTPEGVWKVTLGSGERQSFGALVVAAGGGSTPRQPDALPGEFAGNQLHADECDVTVLRDREVVIVGSGRRACDLATEASYAARSVRLCVRRPRHVLPAIALGRPYDRVPGLRYLLGESIGAGALALRLPPGVRRRLLAAGRTALTSPALHGLPEAAPDAEAIVAPQLLERLLHGRIEIGPSPERLEGDRVRLADGSRVRADTIVWCSGRTAAFPFLPAQLAPLGAAGPELFRNVLRPGVPGLAFVGLAEPTTGSLTRIVETQADWVAAQLSGRCAAPRERQMRALVARHRHRAARRRPFAVEGDYTRSLRRELHAGMRRAG